MVPGKTRVLLADDHAVLRSGLRLLINSQDDMEVIGEVGTGEEVINTVKSLMPDVLLLDLSMPVIDGVSIIKSLKDRGDQTKILVLTMHEEEGYLKNVIRAGGTGYILKKAADTELLTALRSVAKGIRVIDPVMAGNLVTRIWSADDGGNNQLNCPLSERESEVLRLIALGYTNRQIADKLIVSIKTVESHKANIKCKLGLTSRSELVRYAIENKII